MAKKEKGSAGMALTRRHNLTLHYQVEQLEDLLDIANEKILGLQEENIKLKKRIEYLDKHAFPNRIRTE